MYALIFQQYWEVFHTRIKHTSAHKRVYLAHLHIQTPTSTLTSISSRIWLKSFINISRCGTQMMGDVFNTFSQGSFSTLHVVLCGFAFLLQLHELFFIIQWANRIRTIILRTELNWNERAEVCHIGIKDWEIYYLRFLNFFSRGFPWSEQGKF